MSYLLVGFVGLIFPLVFIAFAFLWDRYFPSRRAGWTLPEQFDYAGDHVRFKTAHIEIPTGMYLLLFQDTDAGSFGADPGFPNRVYIVKSIHDAALALITRPDNDNVFVLDSNHDLLLNNWGAGDGQWFGHEARLPWLTSNRPGTQHVDRGGVVENLISERAVWKMKL